MFNMNIYMKTNFLKSLNRINNGLIYNHKNINNNNLFWNNSCKEFSSIIKRKGKGDWNFVFLLSNKANKIPQKYRL